MVPLAGLVVKWARQLCSIVGRDVTEDGVVVSVPRTLVDVLFPTEVLDCPALDDGRTMEPDTLKSCFPLLLDEYWFELFGNLDFK